MVTEVKVRSQKTEKPYEFRIVAESDWDGAFDAKEYYFNPLEMNIEVFARHGDAEEVLLLSSEASAAYCKTISKEEPGSMISILDSISEEWGEVGWQLFKAKRRKVICGTLDPRGQMGSKKNGPPNSVLLFDLECLNGEPDEMLFLDDFPIQTLIEGLRLVCEPMSVRRTASWTVIFMGCERVQRSHGKWLKKFAHDECDAFYCSAPLLLEKDYFFGYFEKHAVLGGYEYIQPKGYVPIKADVLCKE